MECDYDLSPQIDTVRLVFSGGYAVTMKYSEHIDVTLSDIKLFAKLKKSDSALDFMKQVSYIYFGYSNDIFSDKYIIDSNEKEQTVSDIINILKENLENNTQLFAIKFAYKYRTQVDSYYAEFGDTVYGKQ